VGGQGDDVEGPIGDRLSRHRNDAVRLRDRSACVACACVRACGVCVCVVEW
jgi:hypothetical protein